ncbi:glycosyltransferase family 8 protein [Parapedobacter soli]|uniref:glycosyltransferase family 8 protein n=1 Tax=Parapedobacter soli TaxID=416955 RepID=UPI0021C743B3|nr:glycosyltransferase family 8 protein [Parapedobacter soli]
MISDQTISLIVASNNHYAILIAALLKSIDINHKTTELIDFYIIDDNISTINKQKLRQTVDPTRISLIWIDRNNIIPPGLTLPPDSSSFPPTIYYRIFAPYIVNQEIDRLIYIDVDTIVRTDISELWGIDLGEYTIGAVQDIGKTVTSPWGGIPNYQELGLSSDTPYFNSGVLVIDTKRWREQSISSRVIDALIKYKEYVILPDQYGLNVVFANAWHMVDPRWNWSASAEHENPYLLHFLHIKPIFRSCYSKERWKNEFFDYLNQTPFRGFKPISEYRRKLQLALNISKKYFRKLFS